jgi:hypothetical protein
MWAVGTRLRVGHPALGYQSGIEDNNKDRNATAVGTVPDSKIKLRAISRLVLRIRAARVNFNAQQIKTI